MKRSFVAFFLLLPFIGGSAAANVTPVGNMWASHVESIVAIGGDGRVLITGGFVNGTSSSYADIFNPATGTFKGLRDNRSRGSGVFSATLSDGRILLSGGWYAAIDIFDPASETFNQVGSMSRTRDGGTATRLSDGRVLLCGGYDRYTSAVTQTAEIFDPATNTSSPLQATMSVPRAHHAATLLMDGTVLITGGATNGGVGEIFDPVTGTFSATGPMIVGRNSGAAAVRLADGRVLFVGGTGDPRSEIYDPATRTFSEGSSLNVARWSTRAVLLPSGKVLVTCGTASDGATAENELFDPATGTFSFTTSSRKARNRHFAISLSDGRILVGGGQNELSAELYSECISQPERPEIVLTAGSNPVCPGSSVTLTALGNYASYRWSNGATTPSVTLAAPSWFVDVTVIGIDANGCESPTGTYRLIRRETLSEVRHSVDGATTFCAGSSGGVLSATPYPLESGPFTYQWEVSTFLGTFAPIAGATTESYTLQSGDFPSAGTFYVRCRVTPDCGAVRFSEPQRISIVTELPATLISAPATICSRVRASVDPSLGHVVWSVENGTIIAAPTSSSIEVERTGSEDVRITASVAPGPGCERTETVTLPVAPLPVPQIEAPVSLCPSTTRAWSARLLNGPYSFYSWSIQNGILDDPGADAVEFTLESETVAPVLSVTVSDGVCSQQASAVLVFGSDPAVTISAPDSACPEEPVTAVLSPAGREIEWVVDNAYYTYGVDAVFLERQVEGEPMSVRAFVYPYDYSSCVATPWKVIEEGPAEPPQIQAPATACVGEASSASIPMWRYYDSVIWTVTNGTIVGGQYTPEITFIPGPAEGDTILSADVAFFYCGDVPAVPATVWAQGVSKPAVTASGPTTFCSGGSVTLTSSQAESYLWSNGATTQSIVVSESGNYGVTTAGTNGCTVTSDPVAVTVHAAPAPPLVSASGSTAFCSGGNVTLTSSDAASYLWSNGATTQSIVVTEPGSYSVTTTDANGCVATGEATNVTVHPTPSPAQITAEGPLAFCEGGSVTLTSAPASSYLWSNGATTQSIVVSDSGSYSVTTADINGCAVTSDAVGVAVHPAPTAPLVSASGPTSFCSGGSVTLTSSAAVSYVWSNGATTQSIVVTDSGSYSVTTRDANGCAATSAPTDVVVKPLPVASITADGPTTFCTGGSVTLTAAPASSYAWSNGATTQSIVVSSPGAYSVTVTNADGCAATSTPVNVLVNTPAPATITPGGPTTFCAGGSVSLTASPGSAYRWSNGATTQSIVATAAGDYGVVVTDANGCESAAAAVHVSVNPATVITQQPQSQTIKKNTSASLSVVGGGTGTLRYQWYKGTSGSGTLIAGATSASYVTPRLSSTTSYWVKVMSDCGSVNSVTATVTIR